MMQLDPKTLRHCAQLVQAAYSGMKVVVPGHEPMTVRDLAEAGAAIIALADWAESEATGRAYARIAAEDARSGGMPRLDTDSTADFLMRLGGAYGVYMQAHQAANPPEDNWVPLVHKRPMPGPEGDALRAAKEHRREAEEANANAALMTAEAGVWRALAALFGSKP